MPKGDPTDPHMQAPVTGAMLLGAIESAAEIQTAKMESVAHEARQLRKDNREDHRQLFKAQGMQGERITTCETEINTMKPRVDRACNGTVRTMGDQAGMRGEWKTLLWVLGIAGAAILGALARGWILGG